MDAENRLTGVLPVKKLIMTRKEIPLCAVTIKNVVTISSGMTLLEASELFYFYKFLSFPVVDEQQRVLGVVDISIFTQEKPEIEKNAVVQEVFQTIGLRLNELKKVSLLKNFMVRYPWLLSTLISGIACALLAGMYELTILKSVLITFFLTLVLGLGESISMQSMAITLQRIQTGSRSFGNAYRDLLIALFFGLTNGLLIFLVSYIWKQNPIVSSAIGLSIFFSNLMAGAWGIIVPRTIHYLKLDPKIAAGPVTLAITDITTLLIYFNLAGLILR